MLELAHNLLAPGAILPPTPVLFFFSGGEEPLCQVGQKLLCLQPSTRPATRSMLLPCGACIVLFPAHWSLVSCMRARCWRMLQSANGFMDHSKWADRVGVFINLESIGPGGVPIVFQHSGAWRSSARMRHAGRHCPATVPVLYAYMLGCAVQVHGPCRHLPKVQPTLGEPSLRR